MDFLAEWLRSEEGRKWIRTIQWMMYGFYAEMDWRIHKLCTNRLIRFYKTTLVGVLLGIGMDSWLSTLIFKYDDVLLRPIQ